MSAQPIVAVSERRILAENLNPLLRAIMERQRICGKSRRRLPQTRSAASPLNVLLPAGRLFSASECKVVVITPLSSIYIHMAFKQTQPRQGKGECAMSLTQSRGLTDAGRWTAVATPLVEHLDALENAEGHGAPVPPLHSGAIEAARRFFDFVLSGIALD